MSRTLEVSTAAGETLDVVTAGKPLAEAAGAAVLIHGRGGTAEDILGLGEAVGVAELALLAPRAKDRSWYPQSFLAPREANEPRLSIGLEQVGALLDRLELEGMPPERVLLLGFSQGACLALEVAARRGRPLGAVAGLTGGLIGARGELTGYEGDLAGTPVFLAAGDPDPHVPWSRVEESAAILGKLGARVRLERYPGRPHTVGAGEVEAVRGLAAAMTAGEPPSDWSQGGAHAEEAP